MAFAALPALASIDWFPARVVPFDETNGTRVWPI
jgi:hypothetical protein